MILLLSHTRQDVFEILKCQFLDQNLGKYSQKLPRQRLTQFSSFERYENASIFGEGLYIVSLLAGFKNNSEIIGNF